MDYMSKERYVEEMAIPKTVLSPEVQELLGYSSEHSFDYLYHIHKSGYGIAKFLDINQKEAKKIIAEIERFHKGYYGMYKSTDISTSRIDKVYRNLLSQIERVFAEDTEDCINDFVSMGMTTEEANLEAFRIYYNHGEENEDDVTTYRIRPSIHDYSYRTYGEIKNATDKELRKMGYTAKGIKSIHEAREARATWIKNHPCADTTSERKLEIIHNIIDKLYDLCEKDTSNPLFVSILRHAKLTNGEIKKIISRA